MSEVFDALGILIACSVAYGLATGTVLAKSGISGRSFRRDVDGVGYWSAIGAYALLSVALIFWF